MADVKLKNGDGTDVTCTGVESVQLRGTGGERVTFAAAGGLNEYKSLLTGSDIGALCEAGCVVATYNARTGIRLLVFTLASENWSLVDMTYDQMLGIVKTHLGDTAAKTKLEALGGQLMPYLSGVFSGAVKAGFMRPRYAVSAPSAQTEDAQTWDGFLDVLNRSLSEINYGSFDWRSMPPNEYGIDLNGGNVANESAGGVVYLPFEFFPVVEDGAEITEAYNIQTPTGTMPTYESGINLYSLGAIGGVTYVNSFPAYGIAGPLVMVLYAGLLLWHSPVEQTIPEAAMDALFGDWGNGNVTLAEGWNVTEITSGANTTEPGGIADLQELIALYGGFEAGTVPFDEMNAYEASVFLPIMAQPYKRMNQKAVSLEFWLKVPDAE